MPSSGPNRPPTRRMPGPIRALIDRGHETRVLLSQDVFLKMMLTKFGGFGYGYILRHFVPRLKAARARPGRHRPDAQAEPGSGLLGGGVMRPRRLAVCGR